MPTIAAVAVEAVCYVLDAFVVLLRGKIKKGKFKFP
jgi:hypothetical protein